MCSDTSCYVGHFIAAIVYQMTNILRGSQKANNGATLQSCSSHKSSIEWPDSHKLLFWKWVKIIICMCWRGLCLACTSQKTPDALWDTKIENICLELWEPRSTNIKQQNWFGPQSFSAVKHLLDRTALWQAAGKLWSLSFLIVYFHNGHSAESVQILFITG